MKGERQNYYSKWSLDRANACPCHAPRNKIVTVIIALSYVAEVRLDTLKLDTFLFLDDHLMSFTPCQLLLLDATVFMNTLVRDARGTVPNTSGTNQVDR